MVVLEVPYCRRSRKQFSTFFHSHVTKSLLLQSVPSLNSVVYTNLLQTAVRTGCLLNGKVIHAHLLITSFKSCLFLLNNLLNMYCKCGDLVTARHMFDRMRERNVTSWNSLISGYCQMGNYRTAMGLFAEAWKSEMKPDKFTFACTLSICAQAQILMSGKTVHGMVVVRGFGPMTFLTNSLIDMYSKCGRIGEAKFIFERAGELDNVSWNLLISAYNRISASKETLKLLVKMHQKGWKMDSFALGSTLKACASFSHVDDFGKILHGFIVKVGLDTDIVISGALLDLYAKMGNVENAVRVFKLLPEPNIIIYNSMIAGFCRPTGETDCNLAHEALQMFYVILKRGMRPSNFTYSSILRACNMFETFEQGKQIHALICKNSVTSDPFIASSLVDIYVKMGSIEDAWRCFNSVLNKDIVCWTSMISGCIQHGQFLEALTLFRESLSMGVKADIFTISSALSACASLAAGRVGQQIQAYGLKYGADQSTIICNSQICMYARSGDIVSARQTFKEMEDPDIISWSVMISGLGEHGFANEALKLFKDMEEHGITANEVTFLSVLSACSRGKLVDEGIR